MDIYNKLNFLYFYYFLRFFPKIQGLAVRRTP